MKLLLITFLTPSNPTHQLMAFRGITKDIEADKFIFCDTRLSKDSDEFESFYQPLGSDEVEKIMNAFLKGFLKKYESVLFVQPWLEVGEDKIIAAIQSLKSNKNVVGPCNDGSLYILGSRQFLPELFENDFRFNEISSSLKNNRSYYTELPVLEV